MVMRLIKTMGNSHIKLDIMKRMRHIFYLLLAAVAFVNCADSKEFVIDGKNVVIEPYGWFDLEAKHDSIVYKVNAGNIIWSIVGIETVIVPILLTGNQLYEPVRKK